MIKLHSFSGVVKVLLFSLLFSNFSASAQKTTIWIVRESEKSESATATNTGPTLSNTGQERAQALMKVLKKEKIQTIYIQPGKISAQTAAPLAEKVRILPRVYTDSVNAFVAKLTRNFQGSNVLIVAQYKDLMPLINALGVSAPFADIAENDYDLLFSVTIDASDRREVFVTNYGKKHHTTEIPQQYLIEKFYPSYIPPMNSH